MWWHASVTPVTQRSTKRRITVQVSLDIRQNPVSKITNTKRAVRVTLVIQKLPSKPEVLSSLPSTGKSYKYNIVYFPRINQL
jgi:hypothetical protein